MISHFSSSSKGKASSIILWGRSSSSKYSKKKKKTFVVKTVGNNWKLKRKRLSFALKNWILTCWCSYLGFGYMFCIVNSTCSPYAEIINIFKVGSFPSHPFRSVPMMQAETLHVYLITRKWLVCFCLLITAL